VVDVLGGMFYSWLVYNLVGPHLDDTPKPVIISHTKKDVTTTHTKEATITTTTTTTTTVQKRLAVGGAGF